jgi:hypothetical protein
MVIPSIAADPLIDRFRNAVNQPKGVIHVSGVWGSSAPMLTAECASSSPRVHLYLVPHSEQADNAREDIELFLGRSCELLPAFETLPGEGAASGEVEAERLRLCGLLLGSDDGRKRQEANAGQKNQALLTGRRAKTKISNLKCQISNFKFKIGDFKFRVSNLKSQI